MHFQKYPDTCGRGLKIISMKSMADLQRITQSSFEVIQFMKNWIHISE